MSAKGVERRQRANDDGLERVKKVRERVEEQGQVGRKP
jgi:hypothetical protein